MVIELNFNHLKKRPQLLPLEVGEKIGEVSSKEKTKRALIYSIAATALASIVTGIVCAYQMYPITFIAIPLGITGVLLLALLANHYREDLTNDNERNERAKEVAGMSLQQLFKAFSDKDKPFFTNNSIDDLVGFDLLSDSVQPGMDRDNLYIQVLSLLDLARQVKDFRSMQAGYIKLDHTAKLDDAGVPGLINQIAQIDRTLRGLKDCTRKFEKIAEQELYDYTPNSKNNLSTFLIETQQKLQDTTALLNVYKRAEGFDSQDIEKRINELQTKLLIESYPASLARERPVDQVQETINKELARLELQLTPINQKIAAIQQSNQPHGQTQKTVLSRVDTLDLERLTQEKQRLDSEISKVKQPYTGSISTFGLAVPSLQLTRIQYLFEEVITKVKETLVINLRNKRAPIDAERDENRRILEQNYQAKKDEMQTEYEAVR